MSTKHVKLPLEVTEAAAAVAAKQGSDVTLLHLGPVSAFADYFLICSVRNPKQAQAVAGEIDLRVSAVGPRGKMEGYHQGDWILIDYGLLVVHIFSEKARKYYDLERLWRAAQRLPVDVS